MKHYSSGQILPMAALLLLSISFFIAAYVHQTRLTIDRIDRQKQADALALRISNEQARALNSLAALNEALSIMLRRAYIYAGAWTATGACAAFLVAPCVRAFGSLSKDGPEFYRGLNRLGEKIEKWQEIIVKWGNETPEQMISPIRNPWLTISGHYAEFAGSAPGSRRLMVHRAEEKAYANMGASEEEVSMADGGDIKNCSEQVQRFNSNQYDEFQTALSSTDGSDEKEAFYISAHGRMISLKDPPFEKVTSEASQFYRFNRATIIKCTALSDLLPFRFSLPKPYVLEPNFDEAQRITLRLRTLIKPIDAAPLFPRKEKPLAPSLSEVLSESGISGGDLNKMEFAAELRKITGVEDETLYH